MGEHGPPHQRASQPTAQARPLAPYRYHCLKTKYEHEEGAGGGGTRRRSASAITPAAQLLKKLRASGSASERGTKLTAEEKAGWCALYCGGTGHALKAYTRPHQ